MEAFVNITDGELEVARSTLSEALSFALDNIDGSPPNIKSFDRVDFVYLIQQLLFRNSTLQSKILNSSMYMNMGDWNISMTRRRISLPGL